MKGKAKPKLTTEKSDADAVRREMFVEQYLIDFNATQAAVRCGYPAGSAKQRGHEMRHHPDVDAAIRNRISEVAMSADEVLMRLAAMARGNIGEFIDASGCISLSKAKKENKFGLVKRVKTQTGKVDSIEVEMYDAQAALEKLGRHHRLFADKIESWQDELIKALRLGTITPEKLIAEIGEDAARPIISAARVTGGQSATPAQ